MTVAEIKAKGTLVRTEEYGFSFITKTYWKVDDTMYVINNDKIISDTYKVA